MEKDDPHSLIVVGHPEGLHLRPSNEMVKLMQEYPSVEAMLLCLATGARANMRSIMDLLLFAAGHGAQLRLITENTNSETHREILDRARNVAGHHLVTTSQNG